MASIRFELDIEMEDGKTYSVVADQRDIAKWEASPNGWPFPEFRERSSTLFWRFLGWSASVRQGQTGLSWDEFGEQCVEVMPSSNEEDGEPTDAEDPGRPAPSAGPS